MKNIAVAHPVDFVQASARNPDYQAYQILHWGFFVAPLLAGLDKFFNLLTDWSMYLWNPIGNLFHGAENFMHIVGAVEIIAAFLVLLKPKVGAPIVALWLLGIIVNLLLRGTFFDIALRDFGLFLAALALSRLSMHFDNSQRSSSSNPS